MATALSSLRPPPTLPPLKGIYAGKYKDRNPDIPTAGKVNDIGTENAAVAIRDIERPESPAPTKKFHRTFRSNPGERIVFYGRAADPQLREAEQMTHGVVGEKSESASNLLNPTPLSSYQQRFLDRLEACQQDARRRPLGRCPDGRQIGLLPKDFDRDGTTFGITVQKFGTAGELLNPDRSRRELNDEEAADHLTYLVSHKTLLPGEQASRGYAAASAGLLERRMGKPTPHDNAGGGALKCMNWVTGQMGAKTDAVVEKRLDDFRERTQAQLGQTLDPIKDTMKVPADHTFGILHKPDDCGVDDLLHGRAPKHFLRGEDRRRALVAGVRTQLKTMNFEKFRDLPSAFAFYDRDGRGKLTADCVRRACTQMQVPLDDSLLEQLIDFCDVDRDGMIDYKEFVNFLNWRDISVRSNATQARQSAEQSVLSRQIDKSIGSHATTNAAYSATVGSFNPSGFRAYGCPTIRSDLPPPAVRSVSDRKSYGNEGSAAACLNPSVFSLHGVDEFDLAKQRTRQELLGIFEASGIDLNSEAVETAFKLIDRDQCSIDEFRQAWAAATRQMTQ